MKVEEMENAVASTLEQWLLHPMAPRPVFFSHSQILGVTFCTTLEYGIGNSMFGSEMV